MENINAFFDTKIGVILTFAVVIGLVVWALNSAGIFRGLRAVLYDWAIDHTTGKYTINNGARILVLFAFLFVFISVHFTITLKPFHIAPNPLSELEIAALLAFIIGAEWVKKPNIEGFRGSKTEISTEGPTTINTAPQAAKAASKTVTEELPDSEIIKAETKPDLG